MRSVSHFSSEGTKPTFFGNREMGEKSGFLNNISNTSAKVNGIPLGGGAALHRDLPIGWQQQAIDQPQEGSLAAATAAEKNQRLAGRNR